MRHVDWNVFARTDSCFLKRYRGRDQFPTAHSARHLGLHGLSAPHGVTKLDYARFVAASLCYMANVQRDAAGLIIFDEDVANYVAPSTRQGQLFRLLHAIEKAEPGTRTDFAKPFIHFQNFLHRRGIVVVLSDFYEQPETIVKTVEPLRYRGNEVILFHVLDPQEIKPKFREPVLAGRHGGRPTLRSKSRRNMRATSTGARSTRTSRRSLRRPAARGWTIF